MPARDASASQALEPPVRPSRAHQSLSYCDCRSKVRGSRSYMFIVSCGREDDALTCRWWLSKKKDLTLTYIKIP